MQKLKPGVWLNDEIINFYMELIAIRSQSENSEKKLPAVHCYSTFFCSTLREKGYSKVRRWTKRVDVFSKDLLFVPINYAYHWTLGMIDMKQKTIQVYDSLNGAHDATLKLLLKYLQEEHQDKKNAPFDTSAWKTMAAKGIPLQENMSDCGVFTCTFAERLSRNHPFDFSQADMELIRKRMVLSIARREIL
ncbi:Sentrin-specific protease 2 [Fennellomyces sp. T-0311]|nr:Sentrin-specific protease 2 [Fennellomyces sp. T-0311]